MASRSRLTRKTQLAHRKEVREQLLKVRDRIDAGFQDQIDRADDNLDFWDAYHCRWGVKQGYDGRQRLYVPLIHNAIEARKTRFLNQLFPVSGRYIEVTTEDGEIPHATMALMELYVEKTSLKQSVLPAMLVSGDVEGQYTLCVTWEKKRRFLVSRETKPMEVGGVPAPGLGDIEVITEELVDVNGPLVEVVSDNDLLILPATSAGVERAIQQGGSVTTICRWTQKRIEDLIEAGEIDSDYSAELLVQMKSAEANMQRNTAKRQAEIAGIKADGKYCAVYRTWATIEVEKDRRLVLAYFGGPDSEILGAKFCPYWNDKPDIISRPVKQMAGLAKGQSLVKPCATMQYFANDILNEAADSATYGMLPVVMTDPEKNPRVDSMVMDVMAVWQTSPKDTQIVQLPQLYQHGFNIVLAAERYINATLSVSPAAIPQRNPTSKPSQAQIAQEQQVDVLSTAVEVGAAEAVLTEVVERFADYDSQFRDKEIWVRTLGELGVKSQMELVPPLQHGNRWRFRWYGVEAMRSAQQIQQQISLMNVLVQASQHPSVSQSGYTLDLVPIIDVAVENSFGPRLAPLIFRNKSAETSLDPEIENGMLSENMPVEVLPMDNDQKHIQSHMKAAQQSMDMAVQARFQHHIQMHQRQMQQKATAQQMMQLAQQMQGQMGAGGGAPQRRGPAPGGQVTMPRQGKQPPGRMHPDQFPRAAAAGGGVIPMPRKF